MSFLLDPLMQEILLQQLERDTRAIPLLDRTCKALRETIQPSQEMREVQAWLEQREGLDNPVETERHEVFSSCTITPHDRRQRTWRLDARFGRKSARFFYTDGLLTLHKNCCSLTLLTEDRSNAFKDSFRGVPDLRALVLCMSSHAILCFERPERLPGLPPSVRRRHRDTVPWTWARAFHVWRASTPTARSGRQPRQPTVGDLRYGVVQYLGTERVVTTRARRVEDLAQT